MKCEDFDPGFYLRMLMLEGAGRDTGFYAFEGTHHVNACPEDEKRWHEYLARGNCSPGEMELIQRGIVNMDSIIDPAPRGIRRFRNVI